MELGPPRARRKVNLGAGFSQLDWMRHVQNAKTVEPKPLTREEVLLHNNAMMDAWMILRGKVYNITKYVPYHPGGAAELLRGLGDDATSLFDEVHPWVSETMLDKYIVGYIVEDTSGTSASTSAGTESSQGKASSPKKASSSLMSRIGLSIARGRSAKNESKAAPTNWFPCKLAERRVTTECRYSLIVTLDISAVPSQVKSLLNEPGTIVKLRKKMDGVLFERPFTPFLNAEKDTSLEIVQATLGTSKGIRDTVTLFLKAYKDGHISVLTAEADLGTDLEIEVRPHLFQLCISPDKRLQTKVLGSAGFRKSISDNVEHICLIAAGTGVMPMLQVLDYIALNRGTLLSVPTVSLLALNRTEQDIPLRDVLVQMLEKCPFFSKLSLALSQPHDQAWDGPVGRISVEMIAAHLSSEYPRSAAEEDTTAPRIRFFVCGSFEFNDIAEKTLLKSNWPGSSIIRVD